MTKTQLIAIAIAIVGFGFISPARSPLVPPPTRLIRDVRAGDRRIEPKRR